MPSTWVGTVEDRYAALDRTGRRCDGNSHRCVHSATTVYQLLPARDFVAVPGGKSVYRQSCSRHTQQFVNNQQWVVTDSHRLTGRRPDDGDV